MYMSDTVSGFRGKYRFLSNFYEVPIFMDNLMYSSVESAYQAAKSMAVSDRVMMSVTTPKEAKKLGKTLILRHDWEKAKDTVMMGLLFQKFSKESLSDKLLATGAAKLVEANTWGDTYWGVCNGVGQNKLGQMLMFVRKMLPIPVVTNSSSDPLYTYRTHSLQVTYDVDPMWKEWKTLHSNIDYFEASAMCNLAGAQKDQFRKDGKQNVCMLRIVENETDKVISTLYSPSVPTTLDQARARLTV